MTAKEMFEILQYDFTNNSNATYTLTKNLVYRGKEDCNDEWQEIVFNLEDKTIDIYKCKGIKRAIEHITSHRSNISLELLQAINKQVEELGWNK